MPVSDICFTNRKRKSVGYEAPTCNKKFVPTSVPTHSDLETFYAAFAECKNKALILKVTEPFHEAFIPQLSLPSFPQPITELYNPATLEMNYHDLVMECEKVFSTIKVNE